jgi:hypothetical protein
MKVAQWTAALRSGKYEQGQNALCAGSAFCCLGVLAEISDVPQMDAVERIANGYDYDDDPIYKFEGGGFSSTSIPSSLWPTFLEDLDLGMKVPETDLHVRGTLHNRLMTMNDDGFSFSEIAAYIEEVANGNQ